jgi:hypothetical protein
MVMLESICPIVSFYMLGSQTWQSFVLYFLCVLRHTCTVHNVPMKISPFPF